MLQYVPVFAARMVSQCEFGPLKVYFVETPLGEYEVTCCPRGLHGLGMVDGVNDENFSPIPGYGTMAT